MPHGGAQNPAAMGYPDLDEARRHHSALHTLFLRAIDLSDIQQLRRIDDLCAQAAVAVRDEHCRQEMAIVAGYATELFSQGTARKYESESLSGNEFLRLQILKALDSFHSRLYSLEAMRRSVESQISFSARAEPRSPNRS
jgi:hypothetical protein